MNLDLKNTLKKLLNYVYTPQGLLISSPNPKADLWDKRWKNVSFSWFVYEHSKQTQEGWRFWVGNIFMGWIFSSGGLFISCTIMLYP